VPLQSLVGHLFIAITSRLTLLKGIVLAVFGQVLRSVAMIHASTNFSHTVAFRKRDNHQLVTDGVYRCVQKTLFLSIILNEVDVDSSAILRMLASFIGRLGRNWLCRTT
jgi:protein-S-isoprenylcysteine O-methyltransferase Ste14